MSALSSPPRASLGEPVPLSVEAGEGFRPCILIPTYNNPGTIRAVVTAAGTSGYPVIVVDDGSETEAASQIAALGSEGLARVVRLERNGGKGAAVKAGFRFAHAEGFTHALQVDADGQHNLDDIEPFLDAARNHPRHLILGAPVFDDTVPKARRWGRLLTVVWVHIETLGRKIQDPMCGFRVYPLSAVLKTNPRGNRMDFDPEQAVRLVWRGTPVLNLPTRVRYLTASEGGVSHFQMFWDNARISWMHTRLVCTAMLLLVTFSFGRTD